MAVMLCYGVSSGSDTGADFLKFGTGGRISAMGEAGAALRTGLMSAYWNPAGISGSQNIHAGAMHSSVMIESSIQFAGGVVPAGRAGVFGMSFMLLRNDPMDRIDYEGNILGDFKWREWALSGIWARDLGRGIHAGSAVKLIVKEEEDPLTGKASGSAYALDAGIIIEPEFAPGFSWGFSVLNAGDGIRMEGSSRKDDLPIFCRSGVSYSYEPLLLCAELMRERGGSWKIGAGAEMRYTENLSLRAGYYEREGNIGGLTYGLGLAVNNVSFDWANLPAGEMAGATRENRFSVKVAL